MLETTLPDEAAQQPSWQPLSSRQRRVVGVLVEKAKTTPDSYPLTVNALTNGCNQKSNRSPQMNLSPDDVEETLDQLREIGAVTEVQGGGRVFKYRHRMYEWLGVDKVELAVLAELLLRGEQTIGELRGRAARMETIAGLDELRPILRSLIEKKLVIALTAEGRGQVVTHGLYKERELQELNAKTFPSADTAESPSRSSPTRTSRGASEDNMAQLRSEVDALKQEVAELRALVARHHPLQQ